MTPTVTLLLALGCRMDNPAFDSGRDKASKGSGESGVTGESGVDGESGGGGGSDESESGAADSSDGPDTSATAPTECGLFVHDDPVCQGCLEQLCCATALACLTNDSCACFVDCVLLGEEPTICQVDCNLDDPQLADEFIGCALIDCGQLCAL